MKGDFSRDTFDPTDHYAGVLKQQGKVDLDADWNEEHAIRQYIEETTTADVVGPCGAPMDGGGFEVGPSADGDLTLSEGRFYVDGILCQVEENASYNIQPHHPESPVLDPVVGRTDLVYLDVWRRHVTSVEDPGIREVALGGPDTTTRIQTVWQVKVQSDVGAITCADEVAGWPPDASQALLTATVDEPDPAIDPCDLTEEGGYQGLGNRLYRVEIHDGGEIGTATFKWSRDNGSVIYAIEEFIDGQPAEQVRVANVGRDQVLLLKVGQWVEVIDDASELSSAAPTDLVQITDVDEADRLVTLGSPISGYDLGAHPKLRRWDVSDGVITITGAGDEFDLEQGIKVSFSGTDFRSGDYWTFAARSITGEIETLTDALPHGIEHHYCSLALVTWQTVGPDWLPTVQDCRNLFPPLTALTRYFYLGGNGQEAMPGDPLPELLRVGLMNGLQPVAGATVEFTAQNPAGRLFYFVDVAGLGAFGVSTLQVTTGPDGTAECAWRPDSADMSPDASQLVTATLLDAAGDPTEHPPIYFNANLSIAGQVSYDPANWVDPVTADHPAEAQDAIDQLSQNYSIQYISGDGQEARPGHQLPGKLMVRVANGTWPAEVDVVFEVVQGTGTVENGGAPLDQVTVTADPTNGLAACDWTLDGSTPGQRVEAHMAGADDQVIGFNATLRTADSIYFDPNNCDLFDTTTEDVQAAIDALCETMLTPDPGIHVERIVRLGENKKILNDDELPVTALADGIRIVFDKAIAAESIEDKPVCWVSLDLPYPMNRADQRLWGGQQLLGYQPIKLAASLYSSGNTMFWVPDTPTRIWLTQKLIPKVKQLKLGERVLAHLLIRGNFIWSAEDRTVYMDGEGFGQPAGDRTDLRLPSGNERSGGDLEMWFWLVSGEGDVPPLVVTDDSLTVLPDTTVTINVLLNDSGSSPLSLVSVTQPTSGSTELAGDSIEYRSLTGFSGVETFTYTVRDSIGNTSQATVTVDVVHTNVGTVIGEVDIPDLVFIDDTIVSGSTTTFFGSGYQPNESGTIVLTTEDGAVFEVGNFIASADGEMSTDLEIPGDLSAGDYSVNAIGGSGSQPTSSRVARIRDLFG